MDLLERYLAAIARHLPDDQKADVTAELRDVLLSEVEDEEARFGRLLSREELEALLVRFGHPLTVAGRYRKAQHLIGPEVFPFWWEGLKAALTLVAGFYLVLAVLVVAGGARAAEISDRVAPDLTSALVFTFAAVTLACAMVERFGKAAVLARWRPRSLPPAHRKLKSHFERSIELGAEVVFILWWTGVVQLDAVFADYGIQVELAPVWKLLFWPILAFSILELGANLFEMLRPGLERVNRIISLVHKLLGLAILSVAYRAGHWLELSWEVWTPEAQATAEANFNIGIRIGIAAAITLLAVLCAIDIWRLWQASRARPLAAAN